MATGRRAKRRNQQVLHLWIQQTGY